MYIKKGGFVSSLNGSNVSVSCEKCKGIMSQLSSSIFDSSKIPHTVASNRNFISLCNRCWPITAASQPITNIEQFRCNICFENLSRSIQEFNYSSHHLCKECYAASANTDYSHNFLSRHCLTDHEVQHEWRSCSRCGMMKFTFDGITKYFCVGSDRSLSAATICIEKPNIFNYQIGNCSHAFVDVFDFIKNKSNVKYLTKKQVAQKISDLPPFFPKEGYEYQMLFQRCGFKLKWCVTCGSVEKELPEWAYDFLT
jgi:hypothetical protein